MFNVDTRSLMGFSRIKYVRNGSNAREKLHMPYSLVDYSSRQNFLPSETRLSSATDRDLNSDHRFAYNAV